jgi:phosphoribosyl-AMP cyclohydrolase
MNIPNNLRFDANGLIPAVIQDIHSNEVLMVAYMNEESLRRTVESGFTWYWSRSRKKFWKKGETSGNVQKVELILYDCDQDTLLIKVEQTGPACHTGSRTCFYRSFSETTGDSNVS